MKIFNVLVMMRDKDFISENLNSFRLQGQMTDIVLILDDGCEFAAHKTMLYAGSKYFRKLLLDNPHIKMIKIAEISLYVLSELLNYIYLSKFGILTFECSQELYHGAHKLKIKRAREACYEFLKENIDAKNSLSLYRFAKNNKILELLKLAKNYICRNFLSVIKENEELLYIHIEDVLSFISADELNVSNEELVWEFVVNWISLKEKERKYYVSKILSHVRIGLMRYEYFNKKIKNHRYVVGNENCTKIIKQATKYFESICHLVEEKMYIPNSEFVKPRKPREVVFAVGGWSGLFPTWVIETYDPRADRWINMPYTDPLGPRAYHGTVVLGTKIYLIGGYDGSESHNSCRSFDVVTKTWSDVAPMFFKRCYVSVTFSNGLIYALGGFDGEHRLRSVECYDPKRNQWMLRAPMNHVRSDADATVHDGKIYIVGGFDGNNCTNTVEMYDPSEDKWIMLSPMTMNRSGVSCISHKGYIYALGGYSGTDRLRSVERFDINTNHWSPVPSMKHARSNFTVAVIEDMILAIGGYSQGTTIDTVEAFDTNAERWKQIFNMKLYRSALSACVVRDIPNLDDYIYKHYDLVILENAERLRSIVKSYENAGSSIYIEIDNMMYINDIKIQASNAFQNNTLLIPVDHVDVAMQQDIVENIEG